MGLKFIRAELHVHTVLSPCAEIEMLPPLIVQEAVERDIQLIAITDHNATGNIAAVQKAAQGLPLTVLPGMELQTREEVHNLCLFETLAAAAAFQEWVNRHLPDQPNRPDYFGEQLLVDENGDFLSTEPRLLLTSADVSIDDACAKVHEMGGVFIPAHVNRTANGLLPTLGFVPEGICLEGLEISKHLKPDEARRQFPQIAGYHLIQSGDVHRLDDFLGVNQFEIGAPTLAEIKLAFNGQAGRAHRILSRTI
ncbi:MAG TPA: PHP domain-containing protein [Anaerolineaceae bacterium]|nr:PHP domain-containing protein [Anaerolineaceae bacterium]